VKKVNFTMHLLVAEHFLEPYSYGKRGLVVDHLDGSKLNNCKSNLEYVPQKVNINRAHDNGQVGFDAAVIVTDLKEDSEVKMRSLREVSRYLGLPLGTTIRHVPISQKYPIYERFKLRLEDEKEFFSKVKFGSKMFYVYDHVKEERNMLNSRNKLALKYGIVSNRVISKMTGDDMVYIGGCSISLKEDFKPITISKKQAIKDRDLLWSQTILVLNKR